METKNPHIDEITYNYFKVGETVVIAHYMIGTDIICYDLKGNSRICKLSDLECIPITKEWLDKNFRYNPTDCIWIDETGQISFKILRVVGYNKDTDVVYVHAYSSDFHLKGMADLAYVHEFQMFLRAIRERNLIPNEYKF